MSTPVFAALSDNGSLVPPERRTGSSAANGCRFSAHAFWLTMPPMNRHRAHPTGALLSCAVVAVAMIGCGDKGTSSSSGAPSIAGSVRADASASVKPNGSARTPGTAAERLGANDLPKLPPIDIGNPEPQKIGDKLVVGEVCKMNGPVMKDESFVDGIGQIALGESGAIFVVDNEHKLRKYVANAGKPCELSLDTTFGDKGILTVAKADVKLAKLVADKSGDLYFTEWNLNATKTTKLSHGKVVEVVCDQVGELHVDASGKSGTLNKMKVSLGAGECHGQPIALTGLDSKLQVNEILPFGDGLAVVGSQVTATKIGLAGADGKVKAVIGEADADKQICSLNSIVPCSQGVCVVDSNCRSLRVWSTDGKWVGVGKLGAMAGLRYPWPVGFVVGKDVAYISMTHSPTDDKDKNSYGLIVRVTGLD